MSGLLMVEASSALVAGLFEIHASLGVVSATATPGARMSFEPLHAFQNSDVNERAWSFGLHVLTLMTRRCAVTT
jgi:hypothetical protein